ncbi:hypothetical protein FRC07_012449, partial [Ceratobasidium sp. 392]
IDVFDFGFAFTLRSEIKKVSEAAKNKKTFPTWSKARLEEMKERQKEGERLEMYLDQAEYDRESELKDLKAHRKEEIENRLLENGWTKQDMEPSPANSSEWHKLIDQPKPLTDRIWNNMYPKLLPMLESNRTYHEAIDKNNRKRDRVSRIDQLVTQIRQALPPLVHIAPRQSTENNNPNNPGTSAAPAPWHIENFDVKVDMPFPSIAEYLTWPMIKGIIENDTPPEDAETSFNVIQEEFKQAVVEWRDKIEQVLVDIWNAGRAEDDEDETKPEQSTSKGKGKAKATARTGTKRNTRKSKGHEPTTQGSSIDFVLPEFIVTFAKPDGTTTTNLSELSPNLQLLLRADTVFKGSIYHSYPAVVPAAALPGLILGVEPEELYGERWEADKIKCDNEGSALARELLARVGRSEATSAEMKALGGNFRCGQCIRDLPDHWEGIVIHYRNEHNQWKQAQEKIKADPKSNFVYHNTHDLSPNNPKPFVHFMTPHDAAEFTIANTAHDSMLATCKVCERMGIMANYFWTFNQEVESAITEHLKNAHDIALAIPGSHFERSKFDVQFFDPYDEEMDDWDEFDDGDSDDGEGELWG